MPEVIALGELLIDFTPFGRSEAGNPVFERNPGGAPANVLAQLAKLGVNTSFIGKVGDDLFGRALKSLLEDAGVGTGGLILSKEYNTTLAFVELDGKGDRSFGFVRRCGADKMLTREETNLSLLEGARLFHFGGVSLTDEPSRGAALYAAESARSRGLLVSYDPNFRPPLWGDDARAVLLEGVKRADILKVSDDECRMLSGKKALREGADYLSGTYGPKLIFVTMGAQGSACWFKGRYSEQKTFDVKTVDTTGAGDAFFGGALYCLLQSGKTLEQLTAEETDRFMRFANAAGSLVTTGRGAICAMPGRAQIEELLSLE